MNAIDVSGAINSLDPATPAIIASQQMASSLGGGLGGVALSMPGIGTSFANFLNSIGDSIRSSVNYVKSKTPAAIANANSAAKDSSGNKVNQETTTQKVEASISSFFSKVFSQTLYIILFIVVLILAFLGSALASNYVGVGKPVGYYIYYMLYGFLLFPIAIPLAVTKHYNTGEPLFYAIWAPMFGGKFGLFSYDIGNGLSKITKDSLAKPLIPLHGLKHSKVNHVIPSK
jgi:hypothetical protein